jgi:predicted naringenin-chalcone synthase
MFTPAQSMEDLDRERFDAEMDSAERKAQWRADLQNMLRHPSGQRVLQAIVEYCGMFAEEFTPSARVYYESGRRSVAKWLFEELIEVDPKPEVVGKMLLTLRGKHE